MKKILLTGGDGFIARNIIEELGRKYHFVAPSHKSLDLVNTAKVEAFFKKKGPFDVVVHCAVVGGPRNFADTPSTFSDNLKIYFNIARNHKHFKKLINLGSGAEYGKQRHLRNVSEKDFDYVVPDDYYGLAKYIVSKDIENSNNSINLRLFGVYGKYEDSSLRFISNAICKSILKMPININRNVFFDYLYIDDFIKILDYFLTHKAKSRIYNVGTGRRVDLITIANKIKMISGNSLPIKVKLKGLANEYTCNNKKLISEIGAFQFINFDRSLELIYEWYFKKRFKLKRKDFLNDYFK